MRALARVATGGGEHAVDRARLRMLLWVASPAAFFVVVNLAGSLGMTRVHRRIALLYGGQPGATVVLVSALAAAAIALLHLVEVWAGDERFSIKLQGSYQTAVIFGSASLTFAWFYVREFAWQYAFLY
jgi:hypothetical protein